MWPSIARTHVSLSIAALTAVELASTAGVVSQVSRVIPNPASTFNSRSRSAVSCLVSRCATFSYVNTVAVVRAVATIWVKVTTPGRTVRVAIRYSHARLNNVLGESCSIARPIRNCSSSLITIPPVGAVLHDR